MQKDGTNLAVPQNEYHFLSIVWFLFDTYHKDTSDQWQKHELLIEFIKTYKVYEKLFGSWSTKC